MSLAKGPAIVTLALAILSGSATASGGKQQPVKVTVTADQSVSELERIHVDRSIAIRLAKARCDVRPAAPDEPAGVVASVRLHGWRESDIPGGEPILDTQTGRDRPGHEREIEVRYSLEVSVSGIAEPVESHQRRFLVTRGTNRLQAYDPATAARDLALARLADDLQRGVCKAAKLTKRAGEKGKR